MSKILNIATGWGRSLGWLDTPQDIAEMSTKRLNICATSGENGGPCKYAKESSFLKFFKGEAKELDAVYCTGCGCPVNEKSLVPNEKCPLNKWPHEQN